MDSIHFPKISSIAKRDLLQATSNTSVRAAADLMRSHNLTSVVFVLGHTPYVFTIEHVLGVIHHGDSLDRPLSELPIPAATTVFEEQTVLDAMELMDSQGSRYLVAIDKRHHITGIVTYTDIAYAIDPIFLVETRTVGEVVKKKELVTFSPDWILEDVLCHLTHVEDSIIVVDGDELVGIVTSKDAFRIALSGRSTDRPLAEYMSSPVVTIPASAPLHEALLVIKTNSIKRAVVVDEANQLVGVVTQSELVGFAYGYWSRLLKHRSGELRELVAMLTTRAEKYRKDSLTDALTGVGNRRQLNQRLRDELERIQRYDGAPFSLLIVDVDRFKGINDDFGHTVGDEVLKAISRVIQGSIRGIDSVCRWGGDEFAILAPHTGITDATTMALRIKSQVELIRIKDGVAITVSIGIGQICDNEVEKNLFDRVDEALRNAKRAGHNRIALSSMASGYLAPAMLAT